MSMGIGIPGNQGIGNSRGGYAQSTTRSANPLSSIAEIEAVTGWLCVGNCSAASSFDTVYWGDGVYSDAASSIASASAQSTSTHGGSLEIFWKAGIAPGSAATEDILAIGAVADTDKMAFWHDGTANAFYFVVHDGAASAGCSATDADCGYTASGDVIHFGLVWSGVADLPCVHTQNIYANNVQVGVGVDTWTPGTATGITIGNCKNINAINGGSQAWIEGFKLHNDLKPNFRDYATRR